MKVESCTLCNFICRAPRHASLALAWQQWLDSWHFQVTFLTVLVYTDFIVNIKILDAIPYLLLKEKASNCKNVSLDRHSSYSFSMTLVFPLPHFHSSSLFQFINLSWLDIREDKKHAKEEASKGLRVGTGTIIHNWVLSNLRKQMHTREAIASLGRVLIPQSNL